MLQKPPLRTVWGFAILGATLLGTSTSCAQNRGAQPHAMGVAEHEAAAEIEDERAVRHGAHFVEADDALGGCTGTAEVSGVCWSSRANPTARHRGEARRHERAAAEHRQAAAQLEETEARECSSVAASDRDQSPFSHREDIVDVEADELGERVVVTFAPIPNLSAEHLQRIVDCHLARNASLGHQVEDMDYCPLVLKGVYATVDDAPGGGLSVTISADTEQARAEVRARAMRLK